MDRRSRVCHPALRTERPFEGGPQAKFAEPRLNRRPPIRGGAQVTEWLDDGAQAKGDDGRRVGQYRDETG